MQPMHRTRTRLPLLGVAAFLLPTPALAAAHGPAPGLAWGIPFVGMLLSIAVLPMLAPHFWHKRMGLVALVWSLALLVPMALLQGIGAAAFSAWHAALAEYFPFVTLLLALFTAAGQVPRPNTPADLPMRVVVPAYILSELKAGFAIGAVLFLPFLLIDMVTASVTTSIGMFQLPPVVVSTPLKILLFVMVDGWNLLASSLLKSF